MRAGRPPPVRVRGNDWRSVSLPAAFVPAEPLSVVVPCYQAQGELDLTLAALERQEHPAHLIDVVVVDDGSEPPIRVPDGIALDVRLVRQARRGFGLARARNNGARAARHEVIVFLDGDLIADEGLLAAHARWHAAVGDAVTLGFCAYADTKGIHPALLRGGTQPVAALFEGRRVDPPWTERHMARTDDLTMPSDDLFRAVVGNNLALRRSLFDELGGFDESFDRYGWEDTEFGWRAQTQGVLLVPVRGAFAWHQGRFRENRNAGKRADAWAQAVRGARRIPHPHFRADEPLEGSAAPRTFASLGSAGPGAAETASRLLAGADRDVVVEAAADRALAFPATPFHVEVPPGARIDRWLLPRLRSGLGAAAVGVATLDDGSTVRIVRAWAAHRARRAGGRPEDYGATVAFALTRLGAVWADLRWGFGRLLPDARRPLRGMPRLVAEAARIRSVGNARAFARWLRAGFGWWLAIHRGGQAPRLRGRARRPRQLAALALRRAGGGRPRDLAAAWRLAVAPAPAYAGDARRVARRAAWRSLWGRGVDARLECLARSLAERSPTPDHSAAAAQIARALASGDLAAAAGMARTAARCPDLRSEKVVSHRYRFVWIANPKVASRSLLRALAAADPSASVMREATLAEVYAADPAVRAYLTFAFVRHPVDRAVSCHGDKIAGEGNVDLGAFAGLAAGMDLDAYCGWLGTPWGSDAYADRHWLSQSVLLREAPGARLPDFIGRFERLSEDFEAVTAGLGMPRVPLPHRNPRPAAPASAAALDGLAKRYARDMELFGYEASAADALRAAAG